EAEKHVLGADVVVAQLKGFPEGELEHLLGPRRERRRTGGGRSSGTDGLLNLFPHRLEADPERLERLRGDTLTLVDQAQQDVLGADEVVVEQPRFFLGQYQDSSGSVGKTFEQVDRLLERLCVPWAKSTGGRSVCCTRGCGHSHVARSSAVFAKWLFMARSSGSHSF